MLNFQAFTSSKGYSELWTITWNRINKFLPNLKDEIFKEENTHTSKSISKVNAEQTSAKIVNKVILNNHLDNKLQESENKYVQNPVISSPLFSNLAQTLSPIGVSEPRICHRSNNYNKIGNEGYNNIMSDTMSTKSSIQNIIITNVVYPQHNYQDQSRSHSEPMSLHEVVTEIPHQISGKIDTVQNDLFISENLNNRLDINSPNEDYNKLSVDSINFTNCAIPETSTTTPLLTSPLSNYFSEGITIPPGTEFFYSANDKPST